MDAIPTAVSLTTYAGESEDFMWTPFRKWSIKSQLAHCTSRLARLSTSTKSSRRIVVWGKQSWRKDRSADVATSTGKPEFCFRQCPRGSAMLDSVGLVPTNALVATELPMSSDWPETGFEEVGRISNGKSASVLPNHVRSGRMTDNAAVIGAFGSACDS
jgi:hypothetical protein